MTRTVKKPEIRRQEILAAASEMFEQHDYDKITMRDIMTRLNIAKGTIYHYFTSKEQLLESVVEQIIEREFETVKKLVQKSKSKKVCALAQMRLLIEGGRASHKHEQILDTLHRPGNTKMHLTQLGRFIERLAPLYAEVIAQGVDEGVFNVDQPLACAEFLLAGAQFITDMGLYPWREDQLQRRASALPALVEAQLGAARGSFSFLNQDNI